jgi:hypothetical protein
MARSRYSKETRAEAAGLALSVGQTAASEALGIPKQTIDGWLKSGEFDDLIKTSRDKVSDIFWAALQVGVVEVGKGFRSDASLKEKAYALGIVYDRHALLTGGATNRSESRDITGTLSDAELVAAVREADRITSERRAEAPAADEAAGE